MLGASGPKDYSIIWGLYWGAPSVGNYHILVNERELALPLIFFSPFLRGFFFPVIRYLWRFLFFLLKGKGSRGQSKVDPKRSKLQMTVFL